MPSNTLSHSSKPDYLLLAVALSLTGMGLATVLSSSAHVAQTSLGDASYFFKRQAIWAIIGLIALLATATLSLQNLRRGLPLLMTVCLVLLVATHLPGVGLTINGATRWLKLGGFQLQPSELTKLVAVLYAAALLANPKTYKLPPRQRLELGLPLGAAALLILAQPDLGTCLVLCAAAFTVLFAAGLSWSKVVITLGAGAAAVLFLAWQVPYQRARLLAYLDPWADAQGIGFHLVQSLLAIGSGGLFGTGWGQSVQKLFYLPERHTDFIFAVWAEETGLVGSLILLGLLLLFAQRGARIAQAARDPFDKLAATGLTFLIMGQALLNMGVVTASVPTTGITLPFISFGGSSLVMTLAAVGLLLNISRRAPLLTVLPGHDRP